MSIAPCPLQTPVSADKRRAFLQAKHPGSTCKAGFAAWCPWIRSASVRAVVRKPRQREEHFQHPGGLSDAETPSDSSTRARPRALLSPRPRAAFRGANGGAGCPSVGLGPPRAQQLLDSLASPRPKQSRKGVSSASQLRQQTWKFFSLPMPSHGLVHLKAVLPLLSSSRFSSSHLIPAGNSSSQVTKHKPGPTMHPGPPTKARQAEAELQTNPHSPQPKPSTHASSPACNLLTSSEQDGMEPRSLATL